MAGPITVPNRVRTLTMAMAWRLNRDLGMAVPEPSASDYLAVGPGLVLVA